MPGYILHLAEAELILQKMRNEGFIFDEEWMNAFRIGNLIPDTKRKTDKVTSHFWDEKDMVNWAIPPKVENFLEKYKNVVDAAHPVELGYYVHLLLDEAFVNEYWEKIIVFMDGKGQVAKRKDEVTTVFLKNKKCEVSVQDFFSSKNYYGDYSRMNDYFLDKYPIQIPELKSGLVCLIDEVTLEEMVQVVEELCDLQNASEQESSQELRVFQLEDLEEFIKEQAKNMFENYKKLFIIEK